MENQLNRRAEAVSLNAMEETRCEWAGSDPPTNISNGCRPTICHSLMQAVGLANDHIIGCFRHEEVKKMTR